MPFPQTQFAILGNQPFNPAEFMPRVTQIVGYGYRSEPNFRRHVFPVDVNMWRFATIMARKIYLVRTFDSNRWHDAEVYLTFSPSRRHSTTR
jgi:hypothetical protein